MKIGIIIIFHNHEKEIDRSFIIKHIKRVNNIEFCLVNNDSKDNTYNILKEIKEACENVSVVNIKTYKPNIPAVKAGARYMFSQYRLDYLGYVNANLLNCQEALNNVILGIEKNKEAIANFNSKGTQQDEIKKILYKKFFSVVDYLIILKLKEAA
ncbi:glycosyltransferase family A protein [Pontimicrobium sp. SW4]|uniref:Glycosyltransferase family A protein n=1 Tax=Pontimicrobium sp. SW4 TaxID=3153519 RepID=A0AAU7BTG3_9FLAO